MSTGSGQVGTGISQGVRSTSGGEDLDSGISVGATLSENFNNGETCGGEHLWWGAPGWGHLGKAGQSLNYKL